CRSLSSSSSPQGPLDRRGIRIPEFNARIPNSEFPIPNSLLPGLLVMARRSERRRNLESLAIRLARQQPIGLLVVDELLVLAVEDQRPADAIGDVAEMRER